jgi:two-component system alkaline phosphatase synthesis response regulator PhoP
MEKHILIIEDEPGLAITLTDRLKSEGYAVTAIRDGAEGLERAIRDPHDLILLDLMLPGMNGLEVCRHLRQRSIETPILMLTARSQLVDKVVGLKVGADDYLTKPFEMAELLARVEVLLRRASVSRLTAAEVHRFGSFQVDFRRTEATRGGKPVALSAKEFHLLRYLIEHRGETVSREELLREVWGYGTLPSTRTVDVHVAWLRQKIEYDPKHPKMILTVVGFGYKFAG